MLVEDILSKLAALNHLRVARNSKSGRPAHQFFGLARPAAAQEQKPAQTGLARYGPERAENFAFPDGQKIRGWAETGRADGPGRAASRRSGRTNPARADFCS